MTRCYGRCARGLRLRASVPHGHWKLTTLVAGLRTAGISAPYVFEGAINGQRFRAYIEQMLVPTLAPGDIVLLDNLRSHKVAGIAEAIAARGAQLIYLPPLQSRSEPDRAGFRQVQGAAAQSRGAHRREPVAHHRPDRRPLPTSRMPQFL